LGSHFVIKFVLINAHTTTKTWRPLKCHYIAHTHAHTHTHTQRHTHMYIFAFAFVKALAIFKFNCILSSARLFAQPHGAYLMNHVLVPLHISFALYPVDKLAVVVVVAVAACTFPVSCMHKVHMLANTNGP